MKSVGELKPEPSTTCWIFRYSGRGIFTVTLLSRTSRSTPIALRSYSNRSVRGVPLALESGRVHSIPLRPMDLPMRSAPLLLALLAACGASDPKSLTDAGTAALNSNDPKGAIASFDRALAGMKATDPDFLRASIGRCQALARTDPERAKSDFVALAAAPPAKVQEPEFVAVASELASRGSIEPAISVAEAGMKRYPESPAMISLRDRIGDAAKKAGDPAALE